MSDSWKDMKDAKEGIYFEKKNNEALERLKKKQQNISKPRLSPVTGKELVQEVILGVVVDRCQESGGVWLDAGELEQIIDAAKEADSYSYFENFFSMLRK